MTDSNEFINAVITGQINKVTDLLEHDPELVNTRTEVGPSAVLMAIYYRQSEIRDLLISRGAQLDLFEACAAGKLDRVQELVEQDSAHINLFAPDGFQPLGLACFFGFNDIVNLLLERGAQVNTPSHNPQQVMPLHSAVAANSQAIVARLLEFGADPNARQESDITPIHEAAQHGNIEIIKMLLSYGADINARSANGRTAISIAEQAGQDNAVHFLREAGGTD